jgi:hypothetical protein
LYIFFWVFPRHQIEFCRRFGTLCQVHLQRLDEENLKSRMHSRESTVIHSLYCSHYVRSVLLLVLVFHLSVMEFVSSVSWFIFPSFVQLKTVIRMEDQSINLRLSGNPFDLILIFLSNNF